MNLLVIGVLHCLPVLSAATADGAEIEVLRSYFDASLRQRSAQLGTQMKASIDASLPKLEKRSHLSVLRSTSNLGQVSYEVLTSSGDKTVRQEVISRYLTADSEPRDARSLAIAPTNYRFRLKSATGSGKRLIYIFQLTPKKKKPGLFEGELWVDGETGMPLRESGQLVKNPSKFIKRIRFVREYEIRGGVAIPIRIETTVDARLVGRAELRIEFSKFNPIREECIR